MKKEKRAKLTVITLVIEMINENNLAMWNVMTALIGLNVV